MPAVLGRVAPALSSKLSLLIDISILISGLPMATALAHEGGPAFSGGQFYLAMVLVAVWMVTATSLRHYDPCANRSRLDDAAMVVVQVGALGTVLLLIHIGTGGRAPLPRALLYVLVVLPQLLAFRFAIARPLVRADEPIDEVLIVGTGALARVTADDLENRRRPRARVIGFLSLVGEPATNHCRDLLGTSADLARCLESFPVSEVYIAGDAIRQPDAMQAAIRVCETVGIPFALPAYPFELDRARPADMRSIADGYVHYQNMDVKPGQLALKRLFDIALSAAALWALVPLLLTVAALIKLTSKGPVFFRQVRVGLHGRTFNMLKFRSMVVDAEERKQSLAAQNEMTGPVFKIRNDPRVTRIGRFIRKYSIDELPQLVNVLRGDMTIVGPRPPVPSEVAKYKPWQRRRLSVRPGLTCIWQVSGRNQITFDQWMYLDMRYIDHWTLLEDLRLIFRTVPVVLTGRGAS
jgi:exopolysaccharide biosynthesis polyprenyl glycosylphosphotransferase